MRGFVERVAFIAGFWLAASGVAEFMARAQWVAFATHAGDPPQWLRALSVVAWLLGLPLMPFMLYQAATGPDALVDPFVGLQGGPAPLSLPPRALAAGLVINSLLCGIVITLTRDAWMHLRDEMEFRGASRGTAYYTFVEKSVYNTFRVWGDGYDRDTTYEQAKERWAAREARLAARSRRRKVAEDGCVPIAISAVLLLFGVVAAALMLWLGGQR